MSDKDLPKNLESTLEEKAGITPEPSVEVSPDLTQEVSAETEENRAEIPETSVEAEVVESTSRAEEQNPEPASVVSVQPAVQAPAERDRLTKEVEIILEEDLTEMFLAMTPAQQAKFKEKGEETLFKVRVALGQAKINASKIFHLIRSWLKIIPGVNRYFLEQEAKIKTDKILIVAEEEKAAAENQMM